MSAPPSDPPPSVPRVSIPPNNAAPIEAISVPAGISTSPRVLKSTPGQETLLVKVRPGSSNLLSPSTASVASSSRPSSSAIAASSSIETPANHALHVFPEVIGKGKFGEVFRAQLDDTGGTMLAVKRVKISSSMPERTRVKCFNEVSLLTSLAHPHIVGCLDAFFDSATQELVIILEMVPGGDLKDMVRTLSAKKRRFTEKRLWVTLRDLSSALAYMHSRRILHRDLKSANVLMGREGAAKLADFGLGRLVAGDGTMEAVSKVGTPLYMPPEILRGERYGGKADVYSLGCIMYEMVRFCTPYQYCTERKLSMVQLFDCIKAGSFTALVPEQCKYSSLICDTIMAMLHAEPTQRPSTAALHALAAVVAGELTQGRAVPPADSLRTMVAGFEEKRKLAEEAAEAAAAQGEASTAAAAGAAADPEQKQVSPAQSPSPTPIVGPSDNAVLARSFGVRVLPGASDRRLHASLQSKGVSPAVLLVEAGAEAATGAAAGAGAEGRARGVTAGVRPGQDDEGDGEGQQYEDYFPVDLSAMTPMSPPAPHHAPMSPTAAPSHAPSRAATPATTPAAAASHPPAPGAVGSGLGTADRRGHLQPAQGPSQRGPRFVFDADTRTAQDPAPASMPVPVPVPPLSHSPRGSQQQQQPPLAASTVLQRLITARPSPTSAATASRSPTDRHPSTPDRAAAPRPAPAPATRTRVPVPSPSHPPHGPQQPLARDPHRERRWSQQYPADGDPGRPPAAAPSGGPLPELPSSRHLVLAPPETTNISRQGSTSNFNHRQSGSPSASQSWRQHQYDAPQQYHSSRNHNYDASDPPHIYDARVPMQAYPRKASLAAQYSNVPAPAPSHPQGQRDPQGYPPPQQQQQQQPYQQPLGHRQGPSSNYPQHQHPPQPQQPPSRTPRHSTNAHGPPLSRHGANLPLPRSPLAPVARAASCPPHGSYPPLPTGVAATAAAAAFTPSNSSSSAVPGFRTRNDDRLALPSIRTARGSHSLAQQPSHSQGQLGHSSLHGFGGHASSSLVDDHALPGSLATARPLPRDPLDTRYDTPQHPHYSTPRHHHPHHSSYYRSPAPAPQTPRTRRTPQPPATAPPAVRFQRKRSAGGN